MVVLVLVVALVAGGVTAWLLGGGSLPGGLNATAGEAFHDLGSGVSVAAGAPETLKAVADDHVAKPPFVETASLGGVVHVTPDGDLFPAGHAAVRAEPAGRRGRRGHRSQPDGRGRRLGACQAVQSGRRVRLRHDESPVVVGSSFPE
ncbi:hypothetical protein [Amycolatopsis sp. NPDC004169]|uniref:hypothetical protein n=1 Tax=Amycolatopsis sp. NPDC004169 TaxID=3154453 RepID=UPI0033ADBF88